jgi:hypothetical protein
MDSAGRASGYPSGMERCTACDRAHDEVVALVNLTGGIRYNEEPITAHPPLWLCDECLILALKILLVRETGGLRTRVQALVDSAHTCPARYGALAVGPAELTALPRRVAHTQGRGGAERATVSSP